MVSCAPEAGVCLQSITARSVPLLLPLLTLLLHPLLSNSWMIVLESVGLSTPVERQSVHQKQMLVWRKRVAAP